MSLCLWEVEMSWIIYYYACCIDVNECWLESWDRRVGRSGLIGGCFMGWIFVIKFIVYNARLIIC